MAQKAMKFRMLVKRENQRVSQEHNQAKSDNQPLASKARVDQPQSRRAVEKATNLTKNDDELALPLSS